MVPGRGFEPRRGCPRQPLKLVRLPIPPPRHFEHFSILRTRPDISHSLSGRVDRIGLHFLPSPVAHVHTMKSNIINSIVTAGLMFVAGAALAEPPRPGRTLEPAFFGINGLSFLHYRDAVDATTTAQRRMELVKYIGAATDRTDFWWSIIEPTRGNWTWGVTDWLVDFCLKSGIEPFPILSYNAQWMKQSPSSDDDIREYADYVRACVARYKGKVQYWEIWNESNIETFWKPNPNVARYTAILKAGYEAAKAANPECTVVAPATSMTDVNWIAGIAANGGINSFDVLSFHPYSHSDGPEEMDLARQIENMRSTMAHFGRPDIPIWITEMGWQSDIAKNREVAEQMRYLVQSYVIAAAHGVERLYWFNLQDWNEDGKLVGWGMLSPDNRKKPTAQAYRVMRDQLVGRSFIGYLELGKHEYAYAFRKGPSILLVAWSRNRAKLALPSVESVTDLLGNSAAPASDESVILERDPCYIALKQGASPPPLVPTMAPRDNLLVNPSFEKLKGTEPYGWGRGVFYGGSDKGEFSLSKSEAFSGKHSVLITSATDALWQSWPVPVMPGETYELTARVQATSATGENAIQILFLAGPGWGWRGGPSSKTVTGTTDGWVPVKTTGTVPEDADIIRVNLVSKNNPGRVWFDNVRLTRIPSQARRLD